MKPKLTPWFPAHVVPVRIGVYEVDDEDGIDGPWYAYWDGRKFGFRCWKGPQEAFNYRYDKTYLSEFSKWRGLAEDPAKAAP
jgi:hypothetical protein